MKRKYELDIVDPMKYQIIVNVDNTQYYCRISVLGINYLAHFIEDFEYTFQRRARILEYGDGISIIWWARNFPENEIVSVGGDKWWFDWVEELLSKEKPHKVKHLYFPATNYYTTEKDPDSHYAHCVDQLGQFDVIINDGAQREIIGDHILSSPDKFISLGGIYVRHDYEMAILGNWVGLRDNLPSWCRDEKDLGYEGFAACHPGYSVITTTGNGLAGYVVEFGGVWRRVDHQWERRTGPSVGKEFNEHAA